MIKEKISIAACWKKFNHHVFKNKNVTPVQYSEMKMAYYIGFIECFELLDVMKKRLTPAEIQAVIENFTVEAESYLAELLTNREQIQKNMSRGGGRA